jgi:KaiC domain protein
MSEEDDWFERALRDLDEESDRSADAETDEAEGADQETGESDREDEAAGGERVRDDGTVDGDGSDGDDETDPFGGGSFGGGPSGGGSSSEATAGDDFGEAFGGDAESPDFDDADSSDTSDAAGDQFGRSGGGEDDQFGRSGGGEDDQFGGSGGEGDPFGGSGGGEGDSFGGSGGDGDPFGGGSFGDDDPFGGYRNSGGESPDDMSFGEGGGPGAGGGGETEFDVDPDEFESSIERTDIGIEGLDDMILGGVPSRSLLSVIGGAGTGKTTFALQFLNEALESDRKGIYITLEQTRESILSTASEKGWSSREHAEADRLAVVAIDPIEMANSLASIRNDLVRLIAEFDADRLVLDSVSLLEMMYDHPAKRRSEVFGFTRSLKDAGVTTLLTSEASEKNPYASRHGIVEYLTDAVFVLQYIRGSDFRETRLAVEIQKIRDANHSRDTKPYEITDTGISVYGQANIF